MAKKYGAQNATNQRPEGEVDIQKPANNEKIIDKDVGEYIDYEDIDK